MIDLILLIIILCISTTSRAINAPTNKLKKNEEYVCTSWTGSADHSQHSPSVCLTWEKKDKPWHRRS
jgi:hypothetical protein